MLSMVVEAGGVVISNKTRDAVFLCESNEVSDRRC